MSATLFALALLQAAPAPTTPQPAYWQQEVNYKIHGALDEARGLFAGGEEVGYTNNSPDELRTISLHLHLNAFRPGSRWAAMDSLERRRRYNDLKDPDYGYTRITDVTANGQPVTLTYPLAPDSTIVRLALPQPLAPGGTIQLALQFEARPSTTPRRQGRRGRRFDFAQWYPKVVVYDKHGWNENPLVPAGEFYGEFGSFLVSLDLPEDEVMGATGVPICGDPGWERANQVPGAAINYQRDYYPSAPRVRAAGKGCYLIRPGIETNNLPEPPAGRKQVVWYAEKVHHFAMSLNPEYRYEGGAWGNTAIHVLYQPGDEKSWGGGIAVQRTAKALEWLDGFYGPFGWPQLTNVHRIEGGGTEFPMMIHDGSASQGLIVHELGHNYTMGLLANNEWKEGWLDEGFTSFQSSLFAEVHEHAGDSYAQSEPFLTGMDLDGLSEPASLISQDYKDFNSYNISIYSRGEQFFHQLRYIVGDEVLHQIMRSFYERWKYKHVDEAAFKAVAEDVSGRDLSTFFAQALHTNVLYDYAIGRVTSRRLARGEATEPGGPADGGWETRVEVLRKAEGKIPVEVWAIGSDTVVGRTDGLATAEWITLKTRNRPKEIQLDPRIRTRDWNMLNNRWRRGWLGATRAPKSKLYLDTWFSEKQERDRKAIGLLPVAWYNDAAGITLGLRSRENYFGRFAENVNIYSVGTGWESDHDVSDYDFFTRIRNPTFLRSPGMTQTFEGYNVEGRFGGRIAIEKRSTPHTFWGPTRTVGASVTWVQPDDFRYLDRGYYEDAGTVELALSTSVTDRPGAWSLGFSTTLAGGIAYNNEGLSATLGREQDPTYLRWTLEATAKRNLGTRTTFATRLYGGIAASNNEQAIVRQRQIYAAGADPLEQFTNPFLRSSGALLVREDVYYTMPGGGGLRGFDPRLTTIGLVSFSAELERTLVARPRAGLFRRIAIAGFGDVGHTINDSWLRPNAELRLLGDLGAGLRADHRIGQTFFTTRVDFPLYVSKPLFAQDTHPGDVPGGFRWQFSFSPAW
jgi:hypothetical protein